MSNKLKKIIYTVFFTLVGCLMLLPSFKVTAQGFEFDPDSKIQKSLNLPSAEPNTIAIRVIQWVLGSLGLVAVIMILYGGFTWMTAAGNEERLKNAKKILASATIGLVIVLLSWAILTFVVGTVRNVTS